MMPANWIRLFPLLLLALVVSFSPVFAQDDASAAGEMESAMPTGPDIPEGATTAMNAGVAFRNVPAEEPPITNWMIAPVTPIAHAVRENALWITWWTLPFLILPQVLLIFIIIKFRARPGREAAKFHDHVVLETVWTAVPAAVLVVLAIPSYWLIRDMETMPEADIQVKIEGRQYFWIYEYMDFEFSISDEPLIVPANTTVVANITSGDVTHAWWVPAFGVKMDAVPGRITQVWFNVEEEGWYKGQCAELCGAAHALMLIDVWVVSPEEFEEWVEVKRREFLGEDA